jgi:hypothetical protein
MKVIDGGFGKQAPSDLSEQLRELADAVDRKEITGLVAAYVQNDEYSFMFATSLQEAIVLTALLQQRNYGRMVIND